MYARDFRATILAPKDYKINKKNIKNSCYSSHIIIQCIQAFKTIYVVQSCDIFFFPWQYIFLPLFMLHMNIEINM